MTIQTINTHEEFNEVVNSTGLRVVKVSTSTCAPCKMMAKIFSTLDEENLDINLYSLTPENNDEMIALVRELKIISVPTFLVYKDNELTSFTGAFPLTTFKAKIGI